MTKKSKKILKKICSTTKAIIEDTKGDSNNKYAEENLKNNKNEHVEKNTKN